MIASSDTTAGDTVAALRERGDAARDARDWASAEQLYARYCARVPDHAALHVQWGHAAKEAGATARAIEAYSRASLLDPAAADALMHLGHLLLALGERERGLTALCEAWRREPTLALWDTLCAERAITATALLALDDVPQLAADFLCDVSDLLDYVEAHAARSGIQRVQTALAAALQRLGANVAFVFTRDGDGHVWHVAPDDLAELGARLDAPAGSAASVRDALGRLRGAARAARPAPGAVWCILGAFWGRDNAPAHYAALRRDGVRIGALVHDIFPITHPEFAGPGVTARFAPHLRLGLAQWDFVLANSPATARALAGWIADQRLAAPPVITLPLAQGMGRTGLRDDPEPEPRGHVLCVGTIEPRKNHLGLIAAWRTLAARHASLPELVLAGRIGWQADPVIAAIDAAREAGIAVRLIETADDGELARLYRGALFTVQPAHAEGWGLPFGEALEFGKACVIAKGSAMAEAGGDFAVQFDPADPAALAAALERLITEPATLRAAEARIAARFVPRSWDDVARDFLAALATREVRTLPGPGQDRAVPGAPLSQWLRHGRLDPVNGAAQPATPHVLLAPECASPPSSIAKLVLQGHGTDAVPRSIDCATALAETAFSPPLSAGFAIPIAAHVGDDGRAMIALAGNEAPAVALAELDFVEPAPRASPQASRSISYLPRAYPGRSARRRCARSMPV